MDKIQFEYRYEACSLHMVEVFNEITSGAVQLLCLVSIGIIIKSRIIIDVYKRQL